MSGYALRDFQVTAKDAVLREFSVGARSVLMVAATGTGKTTTAIAIAEEFLHHGRVIVCVHRYELAMQFVERFHDMLGIACDVEMADLRVKKYFMDQAKVVVATVQTLCSRGGRMERFSPDDYSLLITDEAHHSVAPSFQRVIDYFKRNSSLKHLGMTATPDRADKSALGKIYQEHSPDVKGALQYEIPKAIADGWLVPIEAKSVIIRGLDFSHIKTTAGDLNGAQLAAEMEREEPLHLVAQAIIEAAMGFKEHALDGLYELAEPDFRAAMDGMLEGAAPRQTLVFTASVAHAERLAEILDRYVKGCAAWVCGKTAGDERRETLRRFAEKQTRILCNVAVLTEGWDCPNVEVVFDAAPTKSRARFTQKVGRGTRPLAGLVDPLPTAEERRAAIAASAKPKLTLLDAAGNTGRHKLVSIVDILGGDRSDEVRARAKRNIAKATEATGLPSDVAKELEKAQKQIDEQTARKLRTPIRGRSDYVTVVVDPFNVFGMQPAPVRGYDSGKTLSEKQLRVIRLMGVDPEKYSYGQLKQLLNAQFKRWHEKKPALIHGRLVGSMEGPASEGQQRVLRNRGKWVDGMTKRQAGKEITLIAAAEGWAPRGDPVRNGTRL